MNLEPGKRYVTRDGRVTDALLYAYQYFFEAESGRLWFPNGTRYRVQRPLDEYPDDLIREYVEPAQSGAWSPITTSTSAFHPRAAEPAPAVVTVTKEGIDALRRGFSEDGKLHQLCDLALIGLAHLEQSEPEKPKETVAHRIEQIVRDTIWIGSPRKAAVQILREVVQPMIEAAAVVYRGVGEPVMCCDEAPSDYAARIISEALGEKA